MKPGYKQTEVGVIPEDWEVVRLGDLLEITSSKRVFQYQWRNVGVPFYRAREIAAMDRRGRVENELFISDELYEALRARSGVPVVGDMLVTGVGTLGRTFVVRDLRRFYFKDGNIIWLKVPRDTLCADYLEQLYKTPVVIRQVSEGSTGTTVGTYTISGAKRTSIALPSIAEQRAIAEALSDADAVIESLEALIAKKRQIKQGAMQELLTGKRRLPGFSGEWETKAIGEICEALRGVTYQPADLLPGDSDGSIRLLRSNNVQAGRITLDETHRVREARVSSEQLMKAGDILMCAANGSRELVGKSARFDVEDGFRYTFGAFMAVIRPRRPVDADLMRSLLDSARFREQVHLALAGSSINNLSPRAIAEFVLELPAEDDERRAIAAVLSDLDAELEALEAKLHKARAIKQGMMQELLTGRTRLVPAEVS